MSIRSLAGQTYLFLVNKPTIVPPFPNIGTGYASTIGIWVYATNNVPTQLFYWVGDDGDQLVIEHDGANWSISGRVGAVVVFRRDFAPVTLNNWVAFAIVIDGYQFTIYTGVQNLSDPNMPHTPVTITLSTNFGYPLDFGFGHTALLASSNMFICCFKYWNVALTVAQINAQMNRWDATLSPTPIWCSPLRTPGDASNIVNPRTGYDWLDRHAYYQIMPGGENFGIGGDPQYMANHTPCPTWIYPLPVRGAPRFFYYPGGPPGYPSMTYNPGTTPLVQTTYNAPEFWTLEDRGAFPGDVQLVSMQYFGLTTATTPGAVQSVSWAIYKDENGIDYPGPYTSTYQFVNSTGNGVPLISNINAENLYLWKYGAQFTWAAGPSVPTATAMLVWPILLVIYLGHPNGNPRTVDTSGLFAIDKGGPSRDRYNAGTVLKIPNPTIKTAFIGE